MRSNRGQFNFAWIFAIIVGGAILFLAIYGALQVGDTQRFKSDTEVAKSIAILTDPLQAGFSEGSFGKIGFQQETRINNFCFDDDFGKNEISVATRSDVGEEWNLAGGATSIHNKYLFSPERGSGEEFYVFSKPFEFPYKIADLIFMTSESYCFINAPEEISDEITGLNIENIEVENCTDLDVNVCFGSGSDCDVTVYGACMSGCDTVYDEGTVEKYGVQMKYVGNLMYGAIFSDKLVYDCNVRRLMYRAAKISEGFSKKTDIMDARGCNTKLKADLIFWGGSTINASSDNLIGLRQMADVMNKKNERELCGVW